MFGFEKDMLLQFKSIVYNIYRLYMTCELHDSYFRLTTITQAIPNERK